MCAFEFRTRQSGLNGDVVKKEGVGIKRAQREFGECAGYVSIIAPIGAMIKVSLVEEEEFPA